MYRLITTQKYSSNVKIYQVGSKSASSVIGKNSTVSIPYSVVVSPTVWINTSREEMGYSAAEWLLGTKILNINLKKENYAKESEQFNSVS